MSSPIGFREFSEDDYRKFIRTLSEEQLVAEGKKLRKLVYPRRAASAFDPAEASEVTRTLRAQLVQRTALRPADLA